MANHTRLDLDPEEIDRANQMWRGFTKATKWSIISIVIVLAMLGAVFINW